MATLTSSMRKRPSLVFSRGFGSSRPRKLTESSTAARFSPSSSLVLCRLALSLAKEREEEAAEGDDVEAARIACRSWWSSGRGEMTVEIEELVADNHAMKKTKKEKSHEDFFFLHG
ncbi:hypothetical protein Fmac_012210 [Flemingia macrophylla]|uniref:Uncharacterized protein n=1 Tax=Flemingia macrophylla TaxID=520843 RepID=A0ABD1MPP1_9FABA